MLELGVMGKYQMNWASLRSGTRVNFQKSSILRNAGARFLVAGLARHHKRESIDPPSPYPHFTHASHRTTASTATTYPLYAITPEIAKYLRSVCLSVCLSVRGVS